MIKGVIPNPGCLKLPTPKWHDFQAMAIPTINQTTPMRKSVLFIARPYAPSNTTAQPC